MYNFLCIRIDACTIDSLLLSIKKAISKNNKTIITNHNLHSLYLCLKDKTLNNWINSQNIVHADGMLIIYLTNILNLILFKKPTLKRTNRITYVDFTPKIFEQAQKENHHIVYIGATQKSLEKGLANIKKTYPNLNIKGFNGFDSLQNITQKINKLNPDILFVGMGMPTQEKWIMQNANNLNAKIILPCGATIDYYSNLKKTPPRWAGKIGLEWLFRLLNEPKRLWKRYLLEPIYITIRIILWPIWQ